MISFEMLDKKRVLFAGIGIAILMVVLIVFFVSILSGDRDLENITLSFWGTFDDGSLYREVIDQYQEDHPNVTIEYRKFAFEDYEKSLIAGFATGTGPDVFLMHNTWLPKHIDLIQSLPQPEKEKDSLLTFKDFQEKFVDVATTDLTRNGQIYALPTYVDTLALYYNKDIFNTAGIVAPPRTWDDFIKQVQELTVKDDKQNIKQSGAAIGTARNINRSTDLLMFLFLQSGVRMTDRDNTTATFAKAVDGLDVGRTALQFYTDFANQAKPDRYAWNDRLEYSIDAFANGNVTMMFNYSHHIQTLRSKAPRLHFAVAPVPQPGGAQVTVSYANYWAPTVAKQSKHALAAWDFLVYLTTTDATTTYLEVADRPAARRDLVERQRNDPDLGVFAVQALSARSWYQADNTAIETIFAKMIDDVNFNRASIRDALDAAETQVGLVMSRSRR